MASVIIIGGAGPKAFCAGGDVAALAQQNESGASGRAASQAYFGLEYQLDHLIATYPKPYVAYMDGITMGGGVGLSVHAPIRIATERTLFAMPETTIGLFPDVGGSFFLPRLEGMLGTYLALTSERLKGVQAFYAGVATHYIDSSSLSNLTSRLAELEFKDYETLPDRLATISSTIAEYDTGLPPNEPILLAGSLRKAIDRNFAHDTMEEIIASLEAEAQQPTQSDDPSHLQLRDWATRTLRTLHDRSPTSLKVTLRQMRQGSHWGIADAFQHEYHLAGKFMAHPDFQSGVYSRLINKPPTNPTWTPSTLAEVTDRQLDGMFRKSAGERRLDLLGPHHHQHHHDGLGGGGGSGEGEGEGEGGWKQYPHAMGLVREERVRELVMQGAWTRTKLMQQLVKREGKDRVGVKEKVEEVVGRCCVLDEEGKLLWRGS